MERYYIALYNLGVKNDLLIKLITEYSNNMIKDMFCPNTDIFLNNMELLPYKETFENKKIVDESLVLADEIIKINNTENIQTALYGNPDYPKNLLRIDNPPAILYYKGAIPNEASCKSIAVIGTRTPTKFAFNAINYLIPQWVNEGFTIVSGLAAGVDRISHISCLAAKGKTIAVLAHGLDQIYPKSNKNLAIEILKNGGTLISEYPVGTSPEKYQFVNRNRIITGLSKSVFSVEFKEKSGSMHSIEFSQKQNIPIFFPDPGNNITIEQTGLRYLQKEKIGTLLKNGTDYKPVILSSGYNIEKATLSTNEILKNYITSLIYDMKDQNTIDTAFSDIGLTYDSSCTSLEDLYKYIMQNYLSHGYNIVEVITCFINSLIKQ